MVCCKQVLFIALLAASIIKSAVRIIHSQKLIINFFQKAQVVMTNILSITYILFSLLPYLGFPLVSNIIFICNVKI